MTVPRLTFALSEDYARMTGGWVYDQRLVEGLERLGWMVERLTLPAGFPDPDAEARRRTAALVSALPDGTLLLIDHLCFSVLPELARAQSSRLRQVVIVHHPLGFEGDREDAAAQAMLETERAALAGARLVVVTSPATAAVLQDRLAVDGARIAVAPPGVNACPTSTGSGGPSLHLLSVGAVVPRKDHGLLLEALGGLMAEDWRLDLVGNLDRAPAHVTSLRRTIDALGLADRVALRGEVPAARLQELWAGTDLYVASSRHEGFGMAIAEAVARGLPVVTTAAGAVDGWLDRRAAVLVPVGDARGLRRALGRVLREPEHRQLLRAGALVAREALPRWERTAAIVNERLRLLAER